MKSLKILFWIAAILFVIGFPIALLAQSNQPPVVNIEIYTHPYPLADSSLTNIVPMNFAARFFNDGIEPAGILDIQFPCVSNKVYECQFKPQFTNAWWDAWYREERWTNTTRFTNWAFHVGIWTPIDRRFFRVMTE